MERFFQQVGELKKKFDSRGLTLSAAESCTGGLFSATLSALPGVSSFFLGSVVSYNRDVKHKILGVPMSLLQVMGDVSTPVALEMAKGAKAAISSEWAISITGVAGPTGGTGEKPVGMVCFAVVGPGFEMTEVKKFGALERNVIQELSVGYALELLLGAVG